jgi:hypothetical protein
MFRTHLHGGRSERGARRYFRPSLECLEGRCVPSTLVALSNDNHLLTFDTSSTGTVTDVAVSGLQPSDPLAAIAFRPSDGQLFGVGRTYLYRLDTGTGGASLIGGLDARLGAGDALAGASFDPTSGLLRVAGSQQENLLIDADRGLILSFDSAFHYRLGDRGQGHEPILTALAYTNELAHATTTTLYAFEEANARDLSIVGGPNGNPSPGTGELSTVAALTFPWNAFTIGGVDNTAYGVLGNSLYTIDLGTGAGSLVDTIGSARGILGLAVKPENTAPPLTVSVQDAAVSESAAGPVTADFTVNLSAASTQTVTVNYSTANDTAFARRDYQAVSGTLTFTPGQTLQTIHIPIPGDAPSALPETFFVQLSSPLGASLARDVAVGTVRADAPPQPLIPSGIYTEDFSDDTDLSQPAFDSTGVFQHFLSIQGQSHTVNDPADTNEVTFGYRIGTGGPPPAVTFSSQTLILSGTTDRVTFPNLVPGTHVAFAGVDATALAGTGTVRIVGENGLFQESVAVGQPTQTESVGEEHVLPSGLELGPISEIDLFGTVAGFDNVKILVVPDRLPTANDVFADTQPNMSVPIDVLQHDTSQDGSPLHLVSVGPAGVPGARLNRTGDQLTYFPAPGYDGADSFTYTIQDGHGQTATGTVHILVRIPPQVMDGNYTIDWTTASLGVTDPAKGLQSLLLGSDSHGPKPTFVIASQPQFGTIDLNAADGTFTYTPTHFGIPGFPKPIFVSDSFTFVANDGLDSNPGTVTIEQGPLAVALSHVYVVSSQHSFSHVSWATEGGFTIGPVTVDRPNVLHPRNAENLIPPEGVLTDDSVLGSPASLVQGAKPVFLRQITVTRLPAHGNLWGDNGVLTLDGKLPFTFPPGSHLGDPDIGTFNLDGSFHYTPDDGFVGLDQFTYKFTYTLGIDGQFRAFDSNEATVVIEVPAADPPASALSGRDVPVPSLVGGSPGPVVTFRTPGRSGGEQLTTLSQVQAVSNPSPADTPSADFPFGFFSFRVAGLGPVEQEATVELVLSKPLPGDPSTWTYWRFGPTPANHTPHWYQFLYGRKTDSDDPDVSLNNHNLHTGAEFLDSTHILLHFVDGQRGDDDMTANGVIFDSGGPANPAVSQTIGVFDPATATWYLKNSNSPGAPDVAPFRYGAPGWSPVVGDWDGSGTATVGVFDPATATWYLKNSNNQGASDIAPFRYGAPGWIPVVGHWAGSRITTIGVVDPATMTWYLKDSNGPGAPDITPFRYGKPGWIPVVGDWAGTGTTTIGVFDPTTDTWYLHDSNSPGAPDIPPFRYGGPGDVPVVGDWTGSGVTTVGVFNAVSGRWQLRNSNSPGAPDITPFAYGGAGWRPLAGVWVDTLGTPLWTFEPATETWHLRPNGLAAAATFAFGPAGSVPLLGDWNGDGAATVGAFDPKTTTWYLRNSNSPGAPDIAPFAFGKPGWIPVVGDWDGNGTTTVGVVDPATMTWYLRDSNTPGAPDITPFRFGAPGWIPVVGDWTGDGKTGIGAFDPATATWYLKNDDGPGTPDFTPFRYGGPEWLPQPGDWEGDGRTVLGVVDPATLSWYLRGSDSPGAADLGVFALGRPGWLPATAGS